jgi:glycosyltransferase involved in cell wall biosynthesis
MPVVSIVLPIYNEQENLRLLVNEIGKELDSFLSDYEIIMVDDGSTDESLDLIRELASNDPRIKYMSFSRNFGQQAALTAVWIIPTERQSSPWMLTCRILPNCWAR